jgi:hypothetical protein
MLLRLTHYFVEFDSHCSGVRVYALSHATLTSIWRQSVGVVDCTLIHSQNYSISFPRSSLFIVNTGIPSCTHPLCPVSLYSPRSASAYHRSVHTVSMPLTRARCFSERYMRTCWGVGCTAVALPHSDVYVLWKRSIFPEFRSLLI